MKKLNAEPIELTDEEIGLTPWLELLRGMVRSALNDARRGSLEAIFWLLDPDTLDLVASAGGDCRELTRRAQEHMNRELKKRAQRILTQARTRPQTQQPARSLNA